MDLHNEQGPIFVTLDPQFTVTGINKAGCALLGCPPSEVIGRGWFETFMPHENPSQINALSAELLASDRSHFALFEKMVQTASGDLQPVRWHNSLIQDEHGSVAGSVSMGTKLTQNSSSTKKEGIDPDGRKAVLSAALEAQEKERQLIAAELHENVTQVLTNCKLILEHNENCEDLPHVQQAIGYLQEVINRVRGISHWLNPKQLSEIGLAASIREMIQGLVPTGKPHIVLHVPDIEVLGHLPPAVQLSLFRIIQEQCSNIVRYAQARRADIYLQLHFDSVSLKIRDDGVGFDANKTTYGLGLRNIKSRAENHEGSMQLQTAPGQGCTLLVRLPIT